MRIRHYGLIASLLFCASTAMAQTRIVVQPRFEVQPFVGYKFGGHFEVQPNLQRIAAVNTLSSLAYGVTAGLNANQYIGVEFLWNRQETYAVGELVTGGEHSIRPKISLNQYHGNVLFHIGEEQQKMRPFILVGLGATSGSHEGNSVTKFSYAVGGGVKYFFRPHMGIRLQARYAPTYVYSQTTGAYCDWWGVCFTISDARFLHQGDVTIGYVFRY